MANDFILTLYSRTQTVFSLKEISLLFPDTPYLDLKSRVGYFVRVGKLKKVRRGIYTKGEYDPLELANKIYVPSYISFETVLQKENIVFQYYETLFIATYLSRQISVDGHLLQYRKMPEKLIMDKTGIEEKTGYFMATKERAFLDSIFLYKDYYFDNLALLDWDKIFELQSLYQSKSLEKRVRRYYKLYKEDNVK